VLDIRQAAADDLEVLIRWHNLPPCEDGEATSTLQQALLHFHLEDKVGLLGGGYH